MDDIAAAAGLGKGTLFRRFGDQRSLLQSLYDQKAQILSEELQSDDGPLGPANPPDARVSAILTAIAHFKLDNLALVRALEASPPRWQRPVRVSLVQGDSRTARRPTSCRRGR